MILKKEIDAIQSYLTDASNFRSNSCDKVYIPENIQELIELMKKLNEENTPFTISGAGTGLVGGRVPIEGVLISMEKFDRILSIDTEAKTVNVEAFVSLNQLDEYLKQYGLFYPPDPTEWNCSIGGTIATNASGARTLKYGSTRNWIKSIKIILPDGEIIELNRGEIFANNYKFDFVTPKGKRYNFDLPEIKYPDVKNAAGYFIKPDMDSIDLFIGSEGTLGIITEAKLKLLPRPQDLLSLVIFFESIVDAYQFVSLARSKVKHKTYQAINPSALEFFDDEALKFLSHKFPNVSGKKFAIWFEQDIYNTNKDDLIEEISNLIFKCNGNIDEIWFAFDEKDFKEIREFRHAISALVNEYISRKNLRKVGTDIAVPPNYFLEFYDYCVNESKKNGLNYVGYGHIGNDHLHFNMLPENEEQIGIALKLYHDFCERAVKSGGTISAEHGVGKIKRKYFELMYPEDILRKMFEIKKIFDPQLLLNQRNIFPDRFFENA